jgi:hypothetical protein
MCNGPVGEGANLTRTGFCDMLNFFGKDNRISENFSMNHVMRISSIHDHYHVFWPFKLRSLRNKLIAMDKKELIFNQHHENQDWLSRLNFYKEEIEILKERLSEVTLKNNAPDVLAKVEHFQNQFIIQRNNIDELAHAININEESLVREIQKNEVASDHRTAEYHQEESDFLYYFESNFANLRAEFNHFISKWM